MNQASWRLKSSIRTIATVAVAAVMLGGCELILAEAPPEQGQTCPLWRGGCLPAIDFAENGSTPVLQSEKQIGNNIAFADRMDVPSCDTVPAWCQLQQGVDVLEERYFGSPSVR